MLFKDDYHAEHKFSEEYACSIVNDMLNAICYLHNYKNIAHRDLKYFSAIPPINHADSAMSCFRTNLRTLN